MTKKRVKRENNGMKRCLFVDADTVIIGLLQEEQKSYVDIDCALEFCSYVRERTQDAVQSGELFNVITDVNPESINRLVLCIPSLLGVENERVYLKGKHSELPSLKEANPYLLRLIHDFITKKGE